MKTKSELNCLVYDFYVTRILFGYYSYGDSLPPMQKISEYFRLAVPTVRTALKLLEKEGYIEISAPKAARVIYKASRKDYLRNIARYRSARKEGLLDMRQVNRLLLAPLLNAGISAGDESSLKDRWKKMKDNEFDGMSVSIGLYTSALANLDNNMVMNFYWEMNRYTRIPYMLGKLEALEEIIEKLDTLPKEEMGAFLTEELESVYVNVDKILNKKIQSEYPKLLDGQYPGIPFEWNFYYKRSQIRYTLGAKMIQEILYGYYPIGSYLPSLPKLAEHYGVSVATIRRTIDFVAGYNIVKSFQGKGTQVCLGKEDVTASQEVVRLALKYFLDGMQFVALTVRPVCRYTLNRISAEELDKLGQFLLTICERKKEYLLLDIFLTFIAERCPSPAVGHCYLKILKCLVMAYPFTLFQMEQAEFDRIYGEMIRQTIHNIEGREIDKITDGWGVFFEEQERYFREAARNLTYDRYNWKVKLPIH